MTITLTHNLDFVIEQFRRAPATMTREVDRGVSRAAQEVAREAKRRAPKADSTLTNSIHAERKEMMDWLVGTSVEHGEYVETGTGLWGPNRHASGRMPPVHSLVDWIRRRRIVPDDPEMDDRDLAYVIGRSIARRGTPKQAYLEPAADAKRGRVRVLIGEGVRRGLGRLAQ